MLNIRGKAERKVSVIILENVRIMESKELIASESGKSNKIYRRGTLEYTKKALAMMFLMILWGGFLFHLHGGGASFGNAFYAKTSRSIEPDYLIVCHYCNQRNKLHNKPYNKYEK